MEAARNCAGLSKRLFIHGCCNKVAILKFGLVFKLPLDAWVRVRGLVRALVGLNILVSESTLELAQ